MSANKCTLCKEPHDKHHALCPITLGQKILDERDAARDALREISEYSCSYHPVVSELKRIARTALDPRLTALPAEFEPGQR